MSSEEEVFFVKKKKVVIANSSDENDLVCEQEIKQHNGDSDLNDNTAAQLDGVSRKENKYRKKQRRITTLDSSSESEQDNISVNDSNSLKSKKEKPRKGSKQKRNVLSSDEKNELVNERRASSDENEEVGSRLTKEESQRNDESSSLESKAVCKNLWFNNTDLYDAEGSSEEDDKRREECNAVLDSEENSLSNEKATFTNPSKEKKPKKSTKRVERKSKTKAQEDIKIDIHKESQRLLRQAPVSIPYHRPKQRTLAEFLERRKCVPQIPLKTSSDQLYTVLKELEQYEKDAELFFMSESSSDEFEKGEKEKSSDIFEVDPDQEKKENNSKTDFENEVFNVNPKCSSETEGIISNFKETDSVVFTKQQEEKAIQVEDSSNVMSDNNKSNKTEKNSQENIIEIQDKVIQQNSTRKSNDTEFIEKIRDEPAKAIKSNTTIGITSDVEFCIMESAKALNITKNESDSCELLTSESSQINIKDKMQASENITSNVKVSQGQLVNHLRDTVDALSVADKSKEECSIGTSCSLVNTEEFSLKLSESLSESPTIENLTLKTSLDETNVKAGVDKSADGSEMTNVRIDSSKDKSDEIKYQTDKPESQTEDESDLYRKYNVELKNPNISVPKIIGSNEEVIDLDEGVPQPEAHQLMKRFLTHLSYKKKQKKKVPVELSIVSAERDGEGNVSGINEESVQVLVGEEGEEEDPSLSRPGAKLMRLRAQLQQQMEKQRGQDWAKKLQDQKLYEDEEVFEGEKDVCDGDEEDIKKTGSDEEKDVTEEEEEEEEEEEDDDSESEDNETDEELAEKKRKPRSVFLDDEAEESDEEVYSKKSFNSKDNCNIDEDLDNDSDGSVTHKEYKKKKPPTEKSENLKYNIIEKESHVKGSNVISDFFIKRPAEKRTVLPRTRTASDMFSSEEVSKYSTDEEELPSFQKPRSPSEKEEAEEKLPETPSFTSPGFQLTALENMDCTKYNWSAPSTPCKDFLSPRIITPVRAIPDLVDKSPQVCTQDLENMCSGHFTSQPIQENEENIQDFDLFLAEDSQVTKDQVTPVKPPTTGKSDSNGIVDTFVGHDEEELAAIVPSKKAKKLNFSDDEDSCDDSQENDAEGDVDENSEQGSVEDGVVDGEVEYDSEENEVEVAKSAGQFLDVEAELSEEEWSSEDEDEQGLDTLEMEEADREKIDQRRLKRQLDQIHMKEMLKEDKKQVKLLQEMLLEDGELHSDNKRQRLFRWSNNVAFGKGDNKAELDSDEEKAEEDEDEENWRKSRHERELFLQEHKKVGKLETLELEDSDSQLLLLGQKALRRLSNSQEPRLTPPTISNPLASPEAKKSFTFPKRGSFLSRGQQALTRLAQIVSSTSDGPIQQPKNSRNFVFTTISPTKDDQGKDKPDLVTNKRKKLQLPLPIAKKPCINNKPKTANKKSLFEALTRVHS